MINKIILENTATSPLPLTVQRSQDFMLVSKLSFEYSPVTTDLVLYFRY